MKQIKVVYGPYADSKNRRRTFVIIHYTDGTKKTTAYARHLLEKHLNRVLTKEETVDHINGDPSDNRLENLQILSRAENIKKSKRSIEWVDFICPCCGKSGRQQAKNHRNNRRQGKAGPFCSRSCAGKAGMV